jgi:hypothetical protein
MNKASVIIALLTFGFAVFLSCTKDKGKGPVANTTTTTTTGATTGTTVTEPCDTVSYKKHIEPIINLNCAISGCHDATASGGAILTSYALVKDKADAGRIKARVLDGVNGFMPSGDPDGLPQNQKDLIKCWLDKGARNN